MCRLARRTLGDEPAISWEEMASDYDGIRDRIARVVPGFERFNDRVRQPGGFLLLTIRAMRAGSGPPRVLPGSP